MDRSTSGHSPKQQRIVSEEQRERGRKNLGSWIEKQRQEREGSGGEKRYSACDVYGGKDFVVAKLQDLIGGQLRRMGARERRKIERELDYPTKSLDVLVRNPKRIGREDTGLLVGTTRIAIRDAMTIKDSGAEKYWRERYEAEMMGTIIAVGAKHVNAEAYPFETFMLMHVSQELG